MAIVDNCCHSRSAILKPFPSIHVGLDVWHFLMRYLICIIDGTKNPLRAGVARDIVDAILKMTADKHSPATYWDRHEQERRMEAVYEKWAKHEGMWTAAAAKVHLDQLTHVRKGCLTRPRQDVRADGSHIEGSHKGWNSLQRNHASRIIVLHTLCHDFVLRQNIRVTYRNDQRTTGDFLQITFSSHHVRLVDTVAKFWNALLTGDDIGALPAGLHKAPELEVVSSGETFGLVNAKSAMDYHNLLEIKEEPDELIDLSLQDELTAESILRELDINPALLQEPAAHGKRPTSALSIPSASGAPRELPTTVDLTDDAAGSSSLQLVRTDVAFTTLLESSSPWVMTASSGQTAIEFSSLHRAVKISLSRWASDLAATDCDAVNPQVILLEGTPSETATVNSVETSQKAEQKQREVDCLPIRIGPSNSSLFKRKADAELSHPTAAVAQSNTAEVLPDSAAASKRLKLSAEGWNSSYVSSKSALHCSSAGAGPSRPKAISSSMSDFFAVRTPRATSSMLSGKRCLPTGASEAVLKTQSALALTLALPALNISGLTASQRVFSISTGIHILSLTILTDNEFYLFMNLRSEFQWVSYNMTPQKWVVAANDYNVRLEALNGAKGKNTIRKTPRALMEKLGEIEPKILTCLSSGKFTCA
ncbi:hypothetical protein SCP_0303590 [Sparassis crispa]|uniref:Uncharacterized protein n=1 Tax=Sparassis crispa TaxID=139825 RepID=A0A401GEN1_9APHY|nr:hypothetical protein SCP_0303590 [Sparassis crispa]GBE80642.1 hypothetical protein SCP_0303590 [Sparassis crispa]